jgi:hypothetical protein
VWQIRQEQEHDYEPEHGYEHDMDTYIKNQAYFIELKSNHLLSKSKTGTNAQLNR